MRSAYRSDLPCVFHALDFLRGDVGGELDYLERLALGVEDRVVGGLDPDFLAAFADPFVLRGFELAAIKLGPEFAVGAAVAHVLLDEDAVMLALDLLQRIADRGEEIRISRDDGSIEVELDYRLRFADGSRLGQRALQFCLTAKLEQAGSIPGPGPDLKGGEWHKTQTIAKIANRSLATVKDMQADGADLFLYVAEMLATSIARASTTSRLAALQGKDNHIGK